MAHPKVDVNCLDMAHIIHFLYYCTYTSVGEIGKQKLQEGRMHLIYGKMHHPNPSKRNQHCIKAKLGIEKHEGRMASFQLTFSISLVSKNKVCKVHPQIVE